MNQNKTHTNSLIRNGAIFLVAVFAIYHSVSAEPYDDNPFLRFSTDYDDIVVSEVRKADTIVLENHEKIKLIGLKAPEPPPQEKVEYNEYGFRINIEVDPAGTLEEKAIHFARDLLEGKRVRVEFDHQQKDDRLNTVAYVFVLEDNVFANAEILRQGYANLTIRPPNIKYADELREAYQEARKEKRGLQGE